MIRVQQMLDRYASENKVSLYSQLKKIQVVEIRYNLLKLEKKKKLFELVGGTSGLIWRECQRYKREMVQKRECGRNRIY